MADDICCYDGVTRTLALKLAEARNLWMFLLGGDAFLAVSNPSISEPKPNSQARQKAQDLKWLLPRISLPLDNKNIEKKHEELGSLLSYACN